jgi:hypothetical protein
MELYSLAFLMLSTWEVIRGSMAAGEVAWPLVLFEELLRVYPHLRRKLGMRRLRRPSLY